MYAGNFTYHYFVLQTRDSDQIHRYNSTRSGRDLSDTGVTNVYDILTFGTMDIGKSNLFAPSLSPFMHGGGEYRQGRLRRPPGMNSISAGPFSLHPSSFQPRLCSSSCAALYHLYSRYTSGISRSAAWDTVRRTILGSDRALRYVNADNRGIPSCLLPRPRRNSLPLRPMVTSCSPHSKTPMNPRCSNSRVALSSRSWTPTHYSHIFQLAQYRFRGRQLNVRARRTLLANVLR